MQFSISVLAWLLASSATAYRIDLWSQYDYQGTQKTFTTTGTHSLGITAKSWIWLSSFNDTCCVVFCGASINVGTYCGSASNTESSAGTTKVVIGCGSATLNC